MGFHDIDLKSEYDSIHDNVYDEFFNKVLKLSRSYNRVGGKFTSKNFAACAEGLQEFIRNDGYMKLVLLPQFNVDDIDSINRGIKNTKDVISEHWIKDFSEVKEKFVEDHTKALAWMLANDHLEIKIVVPIDSSGCIISDVKLEDSQVFQRKTGIFWDSDRESLSFSGNIDFDDAMFGEYHHFRVYRGWDESESKYLKKDFEEFSTYWSGDRLDTEMSFKTISLPEAVRSNLIEMAPKSKSEINLKNIPKLRPYQSTAVRNWKKNDCRGIFEMATGTGKTFAAIGCIKELQKMQEKLLVIIVCPVDNLERQWETELQKWDYDSKITSGDNNWAQHMSDRIASLEINETLNISIIITTYKTFSTKKFVDIVENCDVPLMLISDEVHNAGASVYALGLSNAYNYRLGLSATIERYFDPEGTSLLQNFFGDTVYTLDLKDAIEKKFLVGYYYYPIYADLNKEEYNKYRSHTKTIARLWNSNKPEDRKILEMTLIKRSRIVQNAQNKLVKFEEWMRKQNVVEYVLIYCSENQMPIVKRMLNRTDIINREITANNPPDPKMRSEIIKQFKQKLLGAIVSNRVLDEGADIPSAKSCVMLASTGNPKQFIQRRGRVLRRFNDAYPDGSKKKYATIYDILVIPGMSSDYTENEASTERQIASSQIRRFEEMANIAINRDECMREIDKIKEKFLSGDTVSVGSQ